MGDFNEVYIILYKDSDGTIKPVMNNDGGLRLFMTFTKANTVAKELGEKDGAEYVPHSMEINRDLFK